MSIKLSDLSPDVAEKLGLVDKPPRNYVFSKEQVRQNAIRVMGVMDKLTQAERKRVLAHAIKLNEV